MGKMTEIRAQRVADGLCRSCGLIPPAEGKLVCIPCREIEGERAKNYRKRLLEQGLCSCCRQPYNGDKTVCPTCMEARGDSQRDSRKANKELIYKHFGGKCAHCNETDIVVMTLDHVDNDGYLDKQSINGKRVVTPTWYAKLAKLIKEGKPLERNLQMLCFNCHARKDLTPWWLK